MKSRGAKHAVFGIQVDDQEISFVPNILYFTNDDDFFEWCDLQEVIHDSKRVSIRAVHFV